MSLSFQSSNVVHRNTDKHELKHKLKMACPIMAIAADSKPGNHDAGIFILKNEYNFKSHDSSPN
jgi:hypothetical protein